MHVSYLPVQAEWPDYLFRVTSSLTFRRTTAECEGFFISPAQQFDNERKIVLQQEFPHRKAFVDKVSRHLKCSHTLEDPTICFYTPSISTTISLKYALSVAELQYRRDATFVTITVIDTTTLPEPRPLIWDAEQASDEIHLPKFRDDFKNEFLVFGALVAHPKGIQTVNYLDLVSRLGSFIPQILDEEETTRARFSNFFKKLTKRTTAYNRDQASVAFKIAQYIATPRTIIPLMIHVLLLHDRAADDRTIIQEVGELISRSAYLTKADIQAYFQPVVTVFYTEHKHRSGKAMDIYNFFDQGTKVRPSSMSKETRLVRECFRTLCKDLEAMQTLKIRQRFDLTPTALIVRRFTRGYVDSVVKSVDRKSSEVSKLMQQCQNDTQLSWSYEKLVKSVENCKVNSLSRLHSMLRDCHKQAPHDVS
jgi:hypothetical protein